MTIHKNKNRPYEQYWHDGLTLKQNYQRCAALEKLRRLPHQAIFKLAAKGRQFVSSSRRMPVRDESTMYFFARSFRKGVLEDVVQFTLGRGKKLHIERIVLCSEMRVARTPSCYWIRQLIHAQAGYSPAIHVDEFRTNLTPPIFIDEFERSLPRLKGYKYRGSWIPCAWSAREYGLDDWKRQLSSASPRRLESALTKFLWRHHIDTSEELDRTISETLSPLLVRCLWIPRPSLGILAIRQLERFNPRHPQRVSQHLVPLSLAPDVETRLHLIAILESLDPEDNDKPMWRIIKNLLTDESAAVRKRAIETLYLQRGSLARAGTFEAARLLKEIAQRDPDPEVARSAGEKLIDRGHANWRAGGSGFA